MEIPLDGAVTVRSLVGLLEDVGFSDGLVSETLNQDYRLKS